MEMSVQPLSNGERWQVALQYTLGTLYVIWPLAYLTYQLYTGNNPSQLIIFLVLGYSLVSSYLVFGKQNVQDAFDQAEDMASSGDGDGEDEDQNT